MKMQLMLSVIIISYNQEKYIQEAIDSVLNQKTKYEYEVLLADDCSPDNTKEVLKEYQKKYPDKIKVLPRKSNLGANKNIMDAYLKCKGKYVTVLEGDDYWNNENKIQIQIDFLESHPEYIGISHIQEGRDNNKKILGYFPERLKEDFVINDLEDLLENEKIYSFTATIHKNIFLETKHRKNVEYLHTLDSTISDAQMCEYLLTLGKIYVLKEAFMVYRLRNNDGNSNFNSSYKVNEIQFRFLKIYKAEEEFYKYKYSYYKKIKNCYSLGVAYDLCKFNFKGIKKFNKECPSKYKLKIYSLFPLTCISILWKRFIKTKE